MLVHVATNDEDVNFVEDQQMVDTLRALKPDLAETKIYVDPPGGMPRRPHIQPPGEHRHAGARGFAGADRFVEPHVDVLRVESAPYEDRSKPVTPPAVVR